MVEQLPLIRRTKTVAWSIQSKAIAEEEETFNNNDTENGGITITFNNQIIENMDLFDVISNDIKEAMKAKDKVKLETLRNVKKFFLEAKTAPGANDTLTDDAALKSCRNW